MPNVTIALNGEDLGSANVSQWEIDMFDKPVREAARAQGAELRVRFLPNGDVRLNVRHKEATPELVFDALRSTGMRVEVFGHEAAQSAARW